MAKARPAFVNLDDVPLTRLHLDPENPRHDPIADEEKIIAQLFKAERVLSMAKDIAAKGGISPLERIGVVEMVDNPGHYIVAEGNRRTCALKVLQDIKKAPTAAAKAAIQPLIKSISLPSKFSIVVFKDRETARPWLRLRHLGGQDGAGIRPWDPAQKARFAQGGSPDHLALAILDRAEEAGWIDAATRGGIALTTLTRYLGNPVVRAALGLGHRSDLVFTHAPEEVDAALRRFIGDAVPIKKGEEATITSRSDAAARRTYAQSLHARGIAPRTALSAPSTPPPPKKETPQRKPRGPQHPDDRAYVVPSDFVVKHKDKALQRLLAELRQLKPDDGLVFSTNYLLRAILERIMVLYAKKSGVFRQGLTDRQLTQACHDALLASGVPRNELKSMRIAASNDDAVHSLNTLGAAVHGAHLPQRKGLIAVWDNWESALVLMLTRL